MELLTIELEDLIDALSPDVWAEAKHRILEVGSLENTVQADKAMYFSKAYMLFRRKEKHKGIKLTKKGSQHWKTVLDITSFVTDVFCIENSIEFEAGVKDFLDGGWALGCVSLRDFLYKSEAIAKDSDLRAEIRGDKHKKLTEELLEIYYEEGFTRAGTIKFKLREAKHRVFFVRIARELKDYAITPKTFIREFFDEWSWLGGWPQPKLLMSDYTMDLIKRVARDLNVVKPETKGIYVKVVKDGNRRDQQ